MNLGHALHNTGEIYLYQSELCKIASQFCDFIKPSFAPQEKMSAEDEI